MSNLGSPPVGEKKGTLSCLHSYIWILLRSSESIKVKTLTNFERGIYSYPSSFGQKIYVPFCLVNLWSNTKDFLLLWIHLYWKTKRIAFFLHIFSPSIFCLVLKESNFWDFLKFLYIWNGLDWRALVQLHPPNNGKLRGLHFFFIKKNLYFFLFF